MLTIEEKQFIEFWEKNREKQKKVTRKLSIGLPLGLLFAAMIFINIAAGWHKRAAMVLNADPSLIPVLIIAVILIVVFIVIFSVRHRWDMNEQHYRELISRSESKPKP
ncbi:MAG: hypothetical protein EPN92_03610 [Chitinophagaceae bacterium]|nr:MAG: hypothetical protein EPN92_03610 [Chitinophagaceae bacterium]